MKVRDIRVVGASALSAAAAVLGLAAALSGAADDAPPAEQPKPKNKYAVFASPKSEVKSEAPKGEGPKDEPAKADPKADPKADAPKADAPKADAPKAEPKAAEPSEPAKKPEMPPEPREPKRAPEPVRKVSETPALADGKVRFFTKDIDLEALLQFLEKAAGVKVYRSGLVLPSVRIALNAEKPITVDETLDTLNAVLQTLQPTGYTLIDDRPRFVTIVPLTAVKSAEIPLLPKDPKVADLRDRSRVVRAVFSIRGDDGASVAVAQRSLISPWGELIFNKADNSLTVVDTEKRVKVFRQYLDGIMPPAGDSGSDMVSYILRHIDPEEAAALLRTVVTGAAAKPPNAYAVVAPPAAGGGGDKVGFLVVANPRSRQLLIRGSTEQHAMVREVLVRVDVAQDRNEETEMVKVIRVQSDPDAVAENLREMFREGGGPSPAPGRPFRKYGPPQDPSAAAPTTADVSSAAAIRMSIRITPNRDQRCLVVSGAKADVIRAENIVKEIDEIQGLNPQAAGTRTFEIHHGAADQIAAKLNQVFEGRPDGTDSSSGSSQAAAPVAVAASSGYRDNPYLVRTDPTAAGSSGYGSSGYGPGSSGERGSGRRSRGGGGNGGRVAIADNRLNLLIVTAPNGEFPQIEKLIQELDRGGDIGMVTVPKNRTGPGIADQAMKIYEALNGGGDKPKSDKPEKIEKPETK